MLSLGDSSSPFSTTTLIQKTNDALKFAAASAFKVVSLPSNKPPSKPHVDQRIFSLQKRIRTLLRNKRRVLPHNMPAHMSHIHHTSNKLKSAIRRTALNKYRERDQLVHKVLEKDPSKVYQAIKRHRVRDTPVIDELHVGDQVYQGEDVPDGFFHALLSLKDPSHPQKKPSPYASKIYNYILQSLEKGPKIPPVSMAQAYTLLKRLKPDVRDLLSSTPNHYLKAGDVGVTHFAAIINLIVDNIKLASIAEFNSVWAILLHKGGHKPRHLSSSWRCISSCPLVAKALDLHVLSMHNDEWDEVQAPSQYMGTGSSHELSALAVTEAAVHTVLNKKSPIIYTLLDKEAAFDSAMKEHILHQAFVAAQFRPSQSLLYMAHRLTNRLTYVQHGATLMGPIPDKIGVEQGGIPSGKQFGLVTNKEHKVANQSGLGVSIGPVELADVAFADDEIIISTRIDAMQALISIVESMSDHTNLRNVPSKTKVLVINPKPLKRPPFTPIDSRACAFKIGDTYVYPVNEATHVGLIRSATMSNMPAILGKLAAHSRALNGLLHMGIAKNHRGNPAAGLKLESIYCSPVLLNCLASLFLTRQELNSINGHIRKILRQIQKLGVGTPAPILHFLSGTLPAEASIYIRQFSLLHQLAMKGNKDPLFKIAIFSLSNPALASWFNNLRKTAQEYCITDPLTILQTPPRKSVFMRHVKAQVIAYWHVKLVDEAEGLPNIEFLKFSHIKLGQGPHPVWKTCGNSPSSVRAATVVVKMLSGRYACDYLARHWTHTSGACRMPRCGVFPGSTLHLLTACPHSLHIIVGALPHINNLLTPVPELHSIYKARFKLLTSAPHQFASFLLDPSTDHDVLALVQVRGPAVINTAFKVTRSLVWSLHRHRMRTLGLSKYLR